MFLRIDLLLRELCFLGLLELDVIFSVGRVEVAVEEVFRPFLCGECLKFLLAVTGAAFLVNFGKVVQFDAVLLLLNAVEVVLVEDAVPRDFLEGSQVPLLGLSQDCFEKCRQMVPVVGKEPYDVLLQQVVLLFGGVCKHLERLL